MQNIAQIFSSPQAVRQTSVAEKLKQQTRQTTACGIILPPSSENAWLAKSWRLNTRLNGKLAMNGHTLNSGPRTNPRPFIVETATPWRLPPVCVRCGGTTNQTISLKPKDPAQAGSDFMIASLGLVVHPIHLLAAAKTLTAPVVNLPLCKKCRLNYFLPSRKTAIFVTLHILFFVDAFYNGFQSKFGHMFLDLLLAMTCLVMIALKNRHHDFDALPVKVSLRNGKFRYAIYGGPLCAYFKK